MVALEVGLVGDKAADDVEEQHLRNKASKFVAPKKLVDMAIVDAQMKNVTVGV